MNLSDKQLSDIEEAGKYQFDVRSIATIIQVDPEDLSREIADEKTAAARSYQRGRLLGEFEVRKGVYELATRLSSDAQKKYLDLCDRLKILES